MASDNAMFDKSGYKSPTIYSSKKKDLGGNTSAGSDIERNPNSPSTGGGGGGGSTTPIVDYGGEGDYLAELYRQRQQAAQDAYDKSKALLDDAYNTARGNYNNIYSSGKKQLNNAYNNSLGKINANATDAFRQAYVNRVLSEKNLSQKLAAMGMSGGASESTMAGLFNNYGNARNGIQRTLDTNRNDLEMNYSNNLNDLYSAYQSQIAALDQNRASQLAQLLNNLNNQINSVQNDYFSILSKNPQYLSKALGTATANMNSYEAPAIAEATNTIDPVTTYQGNDQGSTLTNYARQAWEDYMERARANNENENIIMQTLRGTYNLDPIGILKALQNY